VVIVDDHPVVRDGLRGMLTAPAGFEVVGDAADGAEALVVAGRTRPDVVLMDLRMPGVGGVEATARLRAALPDVRVLVLTTYDTDDDIVAAVEAGATGYLLKDVPREELYQALRAAHRGEAVLAPAIAGKLMGRLRRPAPPELSVREREILGLVARGCTNRETAARLFISEATVKTHLLHIYGKLGVPDRASAVAAAYDYGILRPESRGSSGSE